MTRKSVGYLKRMVPFCLIFLLGALFMTMGGAKYLNFDQVVLLQEEMVSYSTSYPVRGLLIFLAVYLVVLISLLPGLLILDLLAGFLFSPLVAFFSIVICNLLGGGILFACSKNAFGDLLKNKGGKWLTKIEQGFNKYQEGYLVFLRVIPFFPFGMISIALGFTKIRWGKFMWTTLLGSLPPVYLLTAAGKEIEQVFEQGISAALLMTPKILIIYALLVALILGPLFVKRKQVDIP